MQKTKHHINIIWLLIIVVFTLSHYGCSSKKRLQKAIVNLDKDMSEQKRAWPYNYTFNEYIQMLDDAKLRQEFYRQRATQAHIAKDNRTEKTMKDNVEKYQRKIDNLEADKKFYKVYKIRESDIKLKIKTEQKAQKNIAKQQDHIDHKKVKEDKSRDKQKKQLMKERQKRLDNRRDRLETQISDLKYQRKSNAKELKDKHKELSTLEKIAQESGTPDDPSFDEGRQILQSKIDELDALQIEINDKIDSISTILDQFIEDNYSKKDTVMKSQMKLSTEAVPKRTEAIHLNDTIK